MDKNRKYTNTRKIETPNGTILKETVKTGKQWLELFNGTIEPAMMSVFCDYEVYRFNIKLDEIDSDNLTRKEIEAEVKKIMKYREGNRLDTLLLESFVKYVMNKK